MRRIGNVLLWSGVAVGVLTGGWRLVSAEMTGWSWVLGVGLTKLAILVALSLIAAGAVALRLANRSDLQRFLRAHSEEVVITGDRKARDDARLRR
jgi:hypothetical protein